MNAYKCTTITTDQTGLKKWNVGTFGTQMNIQATFTCCFLQCWYNLVWNFVLCCIVTRYITFLQCQHLFMNFSKIIVHKCCCKYIYVLVKTVNIHSTKYFSCVLFDHRLSIIYQLKIGIYHFSNGTPGATFDFHCHT